MVAWTPACCSSLSLSRGRRCILFDAVCSDACSRGDGQCARCPGPGSHGLVYTYYVVDGV